MEEKEINLEKKKNLIDADVFFMHAYAEVCIER